MHSADGIFSFEVVSPAAAFGDRLDTIDPDKVAAGSVIVDPSDTWVVSISATLGSRSRPATPSSRQESGLWSWRNW